MIRASSAFRGAWVAGACALVAMIVIGCSGFAPRTIDVPRERIEAVVARHFPVQRRLLDTIDIGLGSPVVTLEPDTNRIAIELVLTLGDRPAGAMRLSQALRYERADHTVRATDVMVERFAIDGLPGSWQRRLDRIGRPLVASLLENQVLYTLRPKDVTRLEEAGLQPSQPRVTADGIRIDIGAAPR